jgi:hypothetical protein
MTSECTFIIHSCKIFALLVVYSIHINLFTYFFIDFTLLSYTFPLFSPTPHPFCISFNFALNSCNRNQSKRSQFTKSPLSYCEEEKLIRDKGIPHFVCTSMQTSDSRRNTFPIKQLAYISTRSALCALRDKILI